MGDVGSSVRKNSKTWDTIRQRFLLYRRVALDGLRNHGEAQGSEIAVKSERRHVIEERGYNYK